MDYEIVKRKALTENDCWCDAMALATGISYEKMMDLFHNFKESDGGLRSGYIDSFLQSKGYLQATFHDANVKWTLDEVMQMYNTLDNHIVVRVDYDLKDENGDAINHLIYITNKEIHDTLDTPEEVEALLDGKVLDVFFKPKEE